MLVIFLYLHAKIHTPWKISKDKMFFPNRYIGVLHRQLLEVVSLCLMFHFNILLSTGKKTAEMLRKHNFVRVSFIIISSI